MLSPESNRTDWFAVQVRSRWEQSTAKLLLDKGYEILLPLYKAERPCGGRVRQTEAPLFPGYVFCRFDVMKRLPVLVTPGVISIVSRGRIPVELDASEVAAIQTLASCEMRAEPFPYLDVGQRVRIEDTPLRGLEGILVAFKGSRRIVVSVSLLHRSVALEIDRATVTSIPETRTVAAEARSRFLAQPVLA